MNGDSITRALRAGAELGEHPIWSEEEDCLYWLDIERLAINRFRPGVEQNTVWELPARPGCFALHGAAGAVIAAQDGVYEMDFVSGAPTRLMAPAHDPQVMRFNDGRTDRQGRLWVGTVRADMDLSRTEANAYYRLDERGLERVLGSVGVTNGCAFSPDGRTMYRAQTETRQIFAYDYDPQSGTPTNLRLFATVPDRYGMPDGATVDSAGGYWVALARPPGTGPQGGVARFTASGELDQYIELPVPFVTMPAFGGRDLSTLYITTARLEAFMPEGTPEGAGDIFALQTEFRGAPETKFVSPAGWGRPSSVN